MKRMVLFTFLVWMIPCASFAQNVLVQKSVRDSLGGTKVAWEYDKA